jgi:tetratricopeptide (TPR) repeat protein
MKQRLGATFLVLAACLAAAPARAADSALDEAKRLTSKASIEYDVGHFDQALELYTHAYEVFPKPALLFDIGQCHRLLGHHERAVFFFQGYLRGQPSAANRALVEKLIADSQHQLDLQAQGPAAGAAAPGPTPTAPAPAGPDVTAPSGAAAPPPSEPAISAPGTIDSSPPSPALRIAGIATAGVGVVLLGVAVFEGLSASSLSGQVSQISSSHGTWTAQAQSDYDSGKSAATAANVLYVTGALVLATGAALTWFGWPRATSSAAAVAPLPGGASLTVVSLF